MRFLWISHVVPYPPKAGFLLRAYHLLNGVARHHTVDLVAFVQEPWLRTIYGDVEAGLDDCRRALSAFCNELHFLPIRSAAGDFGRVATAARALLSGRSYTTSWLQQSDAAGLIAHASQRNRYDLVHFDTIGLAPYRDSVGRRVTTLGHHNIESHLFARRSRTEANVFKRRYYSREGRLLAKYERTMAARFNAHITCSDLDSARLAEVAGPVPAHAIPNGVDCDYFRPSESQHENADTLLFVGTLNWHPNVDAMRFFLTEVWPKLRAARPAVTFDIVGANAPASLIEQASALEGVKLHGFVPDVRPYFARTGVFVCPIMDGGGTKLKVLDAFAMGKAVVAHPISLEGIDAVPGEHVEVASTPQEFVAAIIRLLDDPGRRRQLGENARKLAERKYSFAAIGEQFNGILERVSGEAPRE